LASAYFPGVGRVFLQAECETASINMVYAAGAAGHRSMTGSSGPGISLMQEGISYMAGAQVPGVIVNIMRAGPGLGNIFPEQSDYNQAVKGGGHGCYHNIVVAPASVQEMCDLTRLAFDLSFRYRNPAMVLADGVLGQMMEPLRFPEEEAAPDDCEAWAVRGTAATRGNLITSILMDPDELEAHNAMLAAKYEAMQEDARAEEYQTADADIILAAYGICARVARTAVDKMRASGIKAGLFRPITLFPFPRRALHALAKAKKRRFLAVELSNGQLRDDLLLQLGDGTPVELVSRLGGHLVTPDQIIGAVAAKPAGHPC
jgi:2-oxoisovalerate ferredoxin oxidoreductase alpha subunit